MISKQIFSLNFMFLFSLIEELCRKEESDKTGCNFNFGHECISSKLEMMSAVSWMICDRMTYQLKHLFNNNIP